jgi:hypothetical protein
MLAMDGPAVQIVDLTRHDAIPMTIACVTKRVLRVTDPVNFQDPENDSQNPSGAMRSL